jgi:hypothetical protein
MRPKILNGVALHPFTPSPLLAPATRHAPPTTHHPPQFPNTQLPATFLRLSARPLTCLEAWTYGWYNVSQSAPLTKAMSNKPIRFSSQPLIPQRLAPHVAMSATSPFSSPPANHHLRQPPHLDATRNAFPSRHLRRLALTPARPNPYLRQRNGPCATAICARATRPPRNALAPLSPSPLLPFAPFSPFPRTPATTSPLFLCDPLRPLR